jgi:hypothetical protein
MFVDCRSFPLLGGWHRQNWDLLRPVMGLSGAEVQDLKDTGVYVAGFCDPACAAHKGLYDLFVDGMSHCTWHSQK